MKEKLPNEDYIIPDITRSEDGAKLFRDLQDEKLASVKELISDIEFLIANRKELNTELLKSIEEIKLDIDNSIIVTQNAANAANTNEVIRALGEFRKKKIELEELKLQEKLNFWRDVALLKKELREYARELREKESKSTLLDSLLE